MPPGIDGAADFWLVLWAPLVIAAADLWKWLFRVVQDPFGSSFPFLLLLAFLFTFPKVMNERNRDILLLPLCTFGFSCQTGNRRKAW